MPIKSKIKLLSILIIILALISFALMATNGKAAPESSIAPTMDQPTAPPGPADGRPTGNPPQYLYTL